MQIHSILHLSGITAVAIVDSDESMKEHSIDCWRAMNKITAMIPDFYPVVPDSCDRPYHHGHRNLLHHHPQLPR